MKYLPNIKNPKFKTYFIIYLTTVRFLYLLKYIKFLEVKNLFRFSELEP